MYIVNQGKAHASSVRIEGVRVRVRVNQRRAYKC